MINPVTHVHLEEVLEHRYGRLAARLILSDLVSVEIFRLLPPPFDDEQEGAERRRGDKPIVWDD